MNVCSVGVGLSIADCGIFRIHRRVQPEDDALLKHRLNINLIVQMPLLELVAIIVILDKADIAC